MSIIKLATKKQTAEDVKEAIRQYSIEKNIDPNKALILAGGSLYFNGLKKTFSDIDFVHPDLTKFEKKIINGYELDAGPGGEIVEAARISHRKHGLNVQTPDAILAFYKQMNRPKDQEKIQLLQNHLKGLK